ncbi:serine hydrolase [Novosphingobium ginsenosidimutans]|uniref:serine hydrolase n=1 Tax=Novosphingobium ginsenosidimutans TaxID=1176536 RepID=UPI0013758BB7|nr:serine hydrolase [Novosphingobium ginsenosidimutans]
MSALLALTLSAAGWAQGPVANCHPLPSELGGKSNVRTKALETNLRPAIVQDKAQRFTLAERMAAYQVPGVSIAVIHNGKIDWARGWGVRDLASCRPVTADTAFQAASISKLATAIMALRAVEQGKLLLDDDINRVLRQWQLPNDPKLAPSGVTLRQLLSHTGGLGVHGFAGYGKDQRLPSFNQIMDGEPPANNPAIRSVLPAGSQWQYSGGGYMVVQAALENSTRMDFSRLAQRELLKPLGMTRSAYAQPPSSDILANAALGHVDGKVLGGGFHIYPELAPAGLWTTASDLARLLLDIQASARGKPGHRLSPAMTKAMFTTGGKDWGLGPAIAGTGENLRFGHDGANEGFQSAMIAYAERGEGIVVLTNGNQGRRLADEIVRAAAALYGWTELDVPSDVELPRSAAELAQASGLFEGGGLSVYLDAREDGLFAQTGGPRPERLVPLSPVRFRTNVSGLVIEFAPDYQSFQLVAGGPPMTLLRTKPQAVKADVPIYLRGSMNGWSIGAPLIKEGPRQYAVRIMMQPGEHQLKLASEDWKQVDFGVSAGATLVPDRGSIALVQHGGNIRLLIGETAAYRFTLKLGDDGKTTLSVSSD